MGCERSSFFTYKPYKFIFKPKMPSRQEFRYSLLMRDKPLVLESESFCIDDAFSMVIHFDKNPRKIQIISVDGKPIEREPSAIARSEKCKYTGFRTLSSIECNGKTYVPPTRVSYLWPPLCNKDRIREEFDDTVLLHMTKESVLVQPLDVMPFMDHFGAFMHEYLMVDSSASGAKDPPRRVILYESDGKFTAFWDTKQKTMNIVNAHTTFRKIRPIEE